MAAYCPADPCDTCSDRVVCRCLQVTEQQLVKLITHHQLRSIREIRQHGGAGDGCTCCHPQLQQYLQRYALAVVD